MNFIDKAIAVVAPQAAFKRLVAKRNLALYNQHTGGGTNQRSTFRWLPASGSADDDNLDDLPMARARSREMERNQPLALGALNTVVTSSVGTGLALRSRFDGEALGMDKEAVTAWRKAVEREFCLWADHPRTCDIEATSDFYQLQSLAFRSALSSGDCFGLLPMVARARAPYDLKVQLIEADRVCNPDRQMDTEKIAAGIERGAYGEPLAYYIAKYHPEGSSRLLLRGENSWQRVLAFGQRSGRRNVLHGFDKRRPGQSRGMPYLTPVIDTLKQLSRYTDAEINAAVVSAMFTVFVKTKDGNGLGLNASGTAQTTTPSAGDSISLGSGAIIDLAEGESIETADPKRPNVAFDPFVLAVLRQVGAALELPFEVLVKHFSSSYSASKAALLEAWRFYRGRQAWLATWFCQPVYEAWMDEAVARGRIEAPGYFDDPALRAAYLASDWVADAPGHLDPVKEVKAARERIEAGLSNHTIETLNLTGRDWPEMHEQLAAELEERRDKETLIVAVPTNPAFSPEGEDPADPAGDTGSNDEAQ